jgi:hypothetical protein
MFRAFFDKYKDAFDSIDGQRIAALYHIPTVTMRGDGSIHSLQSRQELARFFQGVADNYQKDGYAGGRFDELQVSPIGGRSAWRRWIGRCCDATPVFIRKWRQSYNLVRDGSVCKFWFLRSCASRRHHIVATFAASCRAPAGTGIQARASQPRVERKEQAAAATVRATNALEPS